MNKYEFWSVKDACWWQFWRPQSGAAGGLIMGLLIFALILGSIKLASASPQDSMIGKRIPASFLVYIPFKDHVTGCYGETNFDLLVRTYKINDTPFRIDTFKHRRLIGHYLPYEKKLYHLDKKGVIDRVVEMERYYPAQECQTGRMDEIDKSEKKEQY